MYQFFHSRERGEVGGFFYRFGHNARTIHHRQVQPYIFVLFNWIPKIPKLEQWELEEKIIAANLKI